MNTVNEIKLTYQPILNHSIKLDTPAKVERYIREVISENYISEEAICIFINRALNPIGYKHLSVGCLAGVIIDVSLICTAALLTRSNGVILCHSHPSGNLTPSQKDIEVTKQLRDALRLFDICLHDHFIITPATYYSFADSNNIL